MPDHLLQQPAGKRLPGSEAGADHFLDVPAVQAWQVDQRHVGDRPRRRELRPGAEHEAEAGAGLRIEHWGGSRFSHQQGEELEGCRVSPVQVLDGNHARVRLRHPEQQRDERVER